MGIDKVFSSHMISLHAQSRGFLVLQSKSGYSQHLHLGMASGGRLVGVGS